MFFGYICSSNNNTFLYNNDFSIIFQIENNKCVDPTIKLNAIPIEQEKNDLYYYATGSNYTYVLYENMSIFTIYQTRA